ncbi:MAG: HAD hydrolase family protein [Candidatus Cloacimonadaceae bacterium]|nr:HAD hydrolase family protein [Candidatus Cloacimonadaceae bacterium]
MRYNNQMFTRPIKKAVNWQNIKLLIFDCDGVLTDGKIIYNGELLEAKNFCAQDGMGFTLLRAAGLEAAVITGRTSKALARRCEDLRIVHLKQGVSNKLEETKKLLKELGLGFSNVVYMGDDWNDVPVMLEAAFSVCPADAMPEICELVEYITHRPGGFGAVRECIDYVLSSMGVYQKAVLKYLDEIT